ncbi:hypothetical protein [Agarivorans sp. DSG3-1]|uniref:hypothetical protein n=1 Tax=Agarivorans sp. DSG3-1 TaxID=3342249 RepID=UPI00398E76CF
MLLALNGSYNMGVKWYSMFGFKKKKNISVKTEWYDLIFAHKLSQWSLVYKNIEFVYQDHNIDLPEKHTLDLYISWIESCKSHIDSKVKEMCENWTDSFIDPSKVHIASIEVESIDRIAVMILGDDTWGDMGYDIWFKNGVIVNEGFGD